MTAEEKQALETAIIFYTNLGTLNRNTSNVKTFLSRVGANINTNRLKYLVQHHNAEIAKMAGAKQVLWVEGSYKPSGRGAFGKRKGGERSQRVQPSIKFIW